MAALFDRAMVERVTMRRSRETWDWRMADAGTGHRRVAEDAGGRVVGYLVGVYGNHLLELVADRDDAIAALLADTAQIFQDGGPETLSVLVTPDDHMLHRIRRMVTCELNMELLPGANWMARVIDVEGFRDALLPEISSRAGTSWRDCAT
jgi:hypothetical protein